MYGIFINFMKGGDTMASLQLNQTEIEKLNATLTNLEQKFGSEYSFTPEISSFACKCSGPAQSCTWH